MVLVMQLLDSNLSPLIWDLEELIKIQLNSFVRRY
jgi:hypothetical protein